MISLSQKQEEIIRSDGYLLITGGPGSGKTSIAILKAQKEVKNLDEHQQVLFLSFSNSAIHQIKQASGITLSKEETRKVKIQTFHSFCFSLLKSYWGLCGIKIPIGVYPPEEEACVRAKYEVKTEEEKERFLKDIATREGRICFDLFAEFTVQILQKSETLLSLLQSCYPLIIIDEFQDTDEKQWEFIKLLGQKSKLICLADPYQRIYDFRAGVTSERLNYFKKSFSPKVLDLGTDNYRSKGNEILATADLVLQSKPVSQAQHISFVTYQYPNQVGFCLKRAISDMRTRLVKEKTVSKPQICVLTRTNKTASHLSDCLKKKTKKANYSIRHDILLDENKIIYVQRFLCTLLEAVQENNFTCLASLLTELIDLHYSYNTITNVSNAKKLERWKSQIKQNFLPSKAKICKNLNTLVTNIPSLLSGNLIEDVKSVIEALRKYDSQYLKPINDLSYQSISFVNDVRLANQANQVYSKQGSYSGIKDVFLRSILQRKILGVHANKSSVVLMTMHKSKGKEYDGIIIFDGPHNDTILLPDDNQPLTRTRTLVRVAMTRARHYVTILHQQSNLPRIFA